MKTLRIVLTLLLAMGLTLSMCGCGESSQSGGEQASSAMGKVATFVYKSEPVLDWDPAVEFSNGIITFCNVYETLVYYNANTDTIEPGLATEWSASDDGTVWTFKLREGVEFHDGTTMNADAVKFSIERTMEKGMGAAFIWDPVSEINVLDEYTVEFVLSYPAALDLIAATGYAAFIYSPAAVAGYGGSWPEGAECGSGPYTVQGFTPSEEVILSKFDNYWRGWQDNQFDKVVIRKVAETASRRQIMERGDGDITYALPPPDVEALRSNELLYIDIKPTMQNVITFLNCEKEPLNDVKVRQAMAYAFPYDDVVNYATGGYATQAVGLIPSKLWGHGKDLYQYHYDLDKARELLEEANVDPASFNLLLTYTAGDEAIKKTAELYKSELAKLGITLEIRAMSWETQWELAKGTEKDRQDVFIMYWWPDISSPYSWFKSLFYSEDTPYYNVSYYSNPEVDSLIDSANRITAVDREAAEDQFIRAQEILLEECPAIFEYDLDTVWVKNKTFQGHVDNPAYPDVVFFYECYRAE